MWGGAACGFAITIDGLVLPEPGPRRLALAVSRGPIAPAVAIGARLWAIVIEGLAAMLALAVKK